MQNNQRIGKKIIPRRRAIEGGRQGEERGEKEEEMGGKEGKEVRKGVSGDDQWERRRGEVERRGLGVGR